MGKYAPGSYIVESHPRITVQGIQHSNRAPRWGYGMTTPDGFFYVSPYKFHSAAAAERAAIEDYEAAARETTEVATATER